MLVRHSFSENKRAYVTPSRIEPLLTLAWDGAKGGRQAPSESLANAVSGAGRAGKYSPGSHPQHQCHALQDERHGPSV